MNKVKNKKFSIKRVIIVLLIIFIAIVACVVAVICWAIYTDKEPQFFPLNNPKGTYMITKGCPNGQGWDDVAVSKGDAFCVAYKGSGVLVGTNDKNTNFFRITVGKSDINLNEFLGKNIKGIAGKFVSSNKQCIQGKCININGPYVVLDIDDVIE